MLGDKTHYKLFSAEKGFLKFQKRSCSTEHGCFEIPYQMCQTYFSFFYDADIDNAPHQRNDQFHTLSANDCKPQRRRPWSRPVFTQLQRRGLEKRFQVQKYITKHDRYQLAAMLGLSETQVKVWFQNRRTKWRQDMKDLERKEDENEEENEVGKEIQVKKDDVKNV